jgi:hypothetical protein
MINLTTFQIQKNAPVTTETITSGENGGSKEDKSNGDLAPIQNCPNPIEADADIDNTFDNDCIMTFPAIS